MALQVTDDPREILFSGDQAEVIEIAHGVRRAVLLHLAIFQREKIDDGMLIDAHGGEAYLAFLELLHALSLETQHSGIEGERAGLESGLDRFQLSQKRSDLLGCADANPETVPETRQVKIAHEDLSPL